MVQKGGLIISVSIKKKLTSNPKHEILQTGQFILETNKFSSLLFNIKTNGMNYYIIKARPHICNHFMFSHYVESILLEKL